MNLLKKIRTAYRIWNERGSEGVINHSQYLYYRFRENARIKEFIQKYDVLTEKDREKMRSEIAGFSLKPLISVVTPVYNVEEKWLRRCIESVLKQVYTNWEFCIADDCSSAAHVAKVLTEYSRKDPRIRVVYRQENGHISAASNSALELAEGEFVAFLDNDDELTEDALFQVVNEINKYPNADMIYSDEDKITEDGIRYDLTFKPDWSPDLFYSLNLVTHLLVCRRNILTSIGGFREGFEGSQDYDLVLRFIEHIPPENIRHIPHILYHWRAVPGSVAYNSSEKPYAYERARRAIENHLHRTGVKARVVQGYAQLNRAIYELPKSVSVSVISCRKFSVGENHAEFILARSNSASAYNEAARHSKGEVLIFLDEALSPSSENWVRELASCAVQKNTGAVGGQILYPDGRICQNGIILGIKSALDFAFKNLPKETGVGFLRAHVISNFSAVAGVLCVEKVKFDAIAGFDERNFNQGLFEIDLCLRLRQRKMNIVVNPHAKFLQTKTLKAEEAIKKNDGELELFKTKWNKEIDFDVYYNPNLSLSNPYFSISIPPRIRRI
jgi:glycosyltransferase involved in cell wall biosynthesis